MSSDASDWEQESQHARVEAALESLYTDLAYVPGSRVGRNRPGPARLSLNDIYVPLRSDVTIDLAVNDSAPTSIVVRQAALRLGQATMGSPRPTITTRSGNVDEAFLELLFARSKDLISNGALQGLCVAPRPIIAAPLWADGERLNVATLQAATAVNVYRRAVLLGPPGSGKSTLAKILALAHLRPQTRLTSGETPESIGIWKSRPLLPVFVELRQLAAHADFPTVDQPAHVEHLLEYIRNVVCRSDTALFAYVITQLYGGHAYLILDGLDEVSIPHSIPDALEFRREQITGLIASVTDRFPQLKILVTSRPAGYSGWTLPGFDVLYLVPLSPAETGSLIRSLYRGMGYSAEWSSKRTAQLESQLPSIPESLRSQPLFVSLLAQLFENNDAALPRQRGALLAEAIDLLLGAWSLPRTGEASLTDVLGCTSEQLLERLEVVALRSLESGRVNDSEEPSIPRSLILDELYELGSHVNPAGALEYVSQHAGILTSPAPRRYRFAHRLFQEYLAASAISKAENPGVVIIDLLTSSVANWREVALLLADVLTNGRRGGEVWELVGDLVSSPSIVLQLMAADVILDQQTLPRVGRIYGSIVPTLKNTFKSILTDTRLSALERGEIGAALAWVGDDRSGVGLREDGCPDVAWCSIPGGRAILGSDDEMRKPLAVFKGGWSYEREEPLHTVDVMPFRLARYPVTVKQYQAFVNAPDGFLNDDWWPDGGLEWKAANPPAPNRPELPDNAPQGGVTWYEAVAFCAWMSARSGEVIRLPTEAQWEWAARGPNGLLYPWGNEPRGDLANSLEAAVSHPISVGSFEMITPWGPDGPEDLIGNVWEWCSSIVETENRQFRYPYEPNDGRESSAGGDLAKRATRGGYFGTSQAVSRSSLRGRDVPSVRVSRQGFRVAGEAGEGDQ
ncbi:SUMF1/EgtB/PvdO family nonheme iron enzyme [Micromonospora zamorensis]|uniref:SUMF1/EgtB/PvdO family nonheme iron enzyme n=1 Tax=Micromonospora zamorensis TaxID=709883 RepID=UPI00370FF1A1